MIGPSAKLLRLLVGWTLATLVVVPFPVLGPLAWAALVVVILLTLGEAGWLCRSPAIIVTRQLPERAFVAQPFDIRLDLSTAGSTRVLVEVLDEPPQDVCAAEPHLKGITLIPGRPTTLTYCARPSRRGNRPFGDIITLIASPLGLLRRRRVHAAATLLRVYPDPLRSFGDALLDPHQRHSPIGSKPARRRGEGMELESLRDYVAGDDPRRVHWGASARRGHAVVRVNQHEANQTVILAIDTSRLMGATMEERSKLDYAVDAALSLTLSALAHGDHVGMASFDREVHDMLAARGSRRQLGVLLNTLQPLTYSGHEANYRALARTLCARQRRRALVIVLTDFAEIDAESLVVPLTAMSRQHQVLVAALRDPVFRDLDPTADEGASTAPLYRRLVLDDLARLREVTLTQLRRNGILTMDVEPQNLSMALVNRYLAIRYGPERR